MSFKKFLESKHKGKSKFIYKYYELLNKGDFETITTNFLDLQEQSIIEEIVSIFEDLLLYFEKDNVFERKRALIRKKDAPFLDFDTIFFKIEYENVFNKLEHRDVKGTIYNLGIEDEFIGDIKEIDDNFYFAICPEVEQTLINSLKKIKNIDIKLKRVENIFPSDKGADKTIVVSSLRLDLIVGSCFNISRGKAKKLVINKQVKLNHKIIEKSSFICDNKEAIISVRGYGRVVIKDFVRKTSKGKFVIEVEIFK